MIIVKLMGGHSNQLFQYALGRQLAIKHDTNLKLDLTWFSSPFDEQTTPRSYELSAYSIQASKANRLNLARIDWGNERPSFLAKVLPRLGVKPVTQLIRESGHGVNKVALNAPDNSYLVGWWQNEKYFENIRDTLLEEFEPTYAMSPKNRKYLESIQNTESVSLHVRREDYVDNKFANKFHGLVSIDHYQNAVNTIQKKLGKQPMHIFVFSKEIEWCKKNIDFEQSTTFIEGNTNGADDMRLMKHCKHNILANSSFSWWGAWLNNNPNKIVVAPRKWFAEKSIDTSDLIPSNWIRL